MYRICENYLKFWFLKCFEKSERKSSQFLLLYSNFPKCSLIWPLSQNAFAIAFAGILQDFVYFFPLYYWYSTTIFFFKNIFLSSSRNSWKKIFFLIATFNCWKKYWFCARKLNNVCHTSPPPMLENLINTFSLELEN
jgi:hypothetical protein